MILYNVAGSQKHSAKRHYTHKHIEVYSMAISISAKSNKMKYTI